MNFFFFFLFLSSLPHIQMPNSLGNSFAPDFSESPGDKSREGKGREGKGREEKRREVVSSGPCSSAQGDT